MAIALGVVGMHAVQAQTEGEATGFAKVATPTLVILNAKVWTGVPGAEDAEAIAITGETISAVGTTEQIHALAGKATAIIDAAGRRVIPGITDSHTHFIEMGLQLGRINLRPAENREAFINLVAATAARLSPGQWMLGGQYSVDSWDDPSPPDKSWIDTVTPGTPVFVNRMDGHQALANSVALKYARIDRDGPPDPPGGEIVRDPVTNEPTGILKDEAMSLVSKHIPPPDERKMYDALMLACQVANAWGITAVHDMTDLNQIPAYVMAGRRDTLTVRVRSYLQTEEFQKELSTLRKAQSEAGGLYEVAGFKSYMDGSLGSRTAYMHEPFADANADTRYPRGFKLAHAAADSYPADIRWANEQGLQMAVHAIGDQANHDLLDIYASIPNVKERRHRIEHAQHLMRSDIPRFAELGVIASMQPFHKADDGRWAEHALGPERSETTYAFNSLLRAGAVVCFGSDTPVVTMNPFSGIAAAVTAKTLAEEVWVPSQRISREDALRCYTYNPHVAAFREQKLGTLEVGKIADIAILDSDILTAPIDDIHRTEAFATILGGRVVWRAESAATE
ncbi:MAG: amidohydrolase [Phycisphaerales bacterium]|nr:amidohydrolase [Phycisphaerales bacterium]